MNSDIRQATLRVAQAVQPLVDRYLAFLLGLGRRYEALLLEEHWREITRLRDKIAADDRASNRECLDCADELAKFYVGLIHSLKANIATMMGNRPASL